jgi:hypothetical protein
MHARMQKYICCLFLALVSYRGASAEPKSFADLEQKFSAVEALGFKYSERDTPTGVGVGNPREPMVRDFEAEVAVRGKSMHIDYGSAETGMKTRREDTFIADGSFEWNLQKLKGGSCPAFVTKCPVGFQESLNQKFAATAPKLAKAIPNCLPCKDLFDPQLAGSGRLWSSIAR